MAICQKFLTTFHNMGALLTIAAIGAGVSAVGAGVSAYGTSQNASATRDQAKFNAYLENKFGKKWGASAQELETQKLDKLYDVGNIFERFEGAGAFGDTNTLENLRKAQSDFAALGAGDFTGFESQLRSIMQDNLVNTVGAGAPVGTYTNISADSVMNLRRQGLGEATSVTGFLSGLSNELLGIEFGVMDRGFEQRYNIDRGRLSAVTGNSMAAAQTSGVGTQAAGGAVQSIGASMTNYGLTAAGYGDSNNNQNTGVSSTRTASQRPGLNTGGYYMDTPSVYNTSQSSYNAPTTRSIYGGGRSIDSVMNVLPAIGDFENVVDGELLPPINTSSYPASTQQIFGFDQMGGAGYVQNWANATLAQVGASIAGQ